MRQKTHRGPAMTLDQALYEMELVGHDFFLFHDAESGTPSVVYRRKGYDYGVLHLELEATRADGRLGVLDSWQPGAMAVRAGCRRVADLYTTALAHVGTRPGPNGW